MTRRIISLVGVLALLTIVPPGSAAAPTTDECAPPCGYISPLIGLDTDVAFPYMTSKLPEFPGEVNIQVTYSWDFDQDGTGLPGDAEEMTIDLALTKRPDWMNAELEPTTCSFTLVPTTTEYDVCTITLTTEVTGYPLSDAALEEYGKRLMVFATSKESGTFKQSYGVEDMRFKFDEAPDVDNGFYASNDPDQVAEAPLGLIAPLALIGAAAITLRRRS